MAERKGPGGEGDERDIVGSGQQDDRTPAEPERDVPAEGAAGDETELTNTDTGAGSGADDTVVTARTDGDATAPDDEAADSDVASGPEATAPRGADADSGSSGAEVITFRRRDEESAGEPPEDEDLDEFDEAGADPVSLAALQADDELLEALGGADPDVATSSGEQPDLEALLVAWRRDVDAVGMDDIVDTDAAVAAIAEGSRRPRARKRRHLVPVATAAAVLMITFTGVGLAARDAMPGDALWGVTQVLYSDYARSAKAVSVAQDQLDMASTAWENGRRDAAQEALERAQKQMRTVDTESRRLPDLRAAHASLSAKFDEVSTSPETSTVTSTSPPGGTSSSEPSQQPTGTLPEIPPSQPPTSTEPSTPSTSPETSDSTSPPESTSGSEADSSTSSGTSGWSSQGQESGILPP